MRPASRGLGTAGGAGGGDSGLGAVRLGTGRLGTGMRPGTASMGAAAMVDVQVTDRPVTQQGISGMRPQSAGPGRQVQDVTYFVGLLRNKITEITKEVAKLKGDIEQCNKDNATYTALERQYETLIKTVRSLEGDLADYNLAMDKSRTGTDPGDIIQYYAALKQRNEYEEREIDKVFLMRQDRERAIAEVEGEIHAIQEKSAAKLQRLPRESQQEYMRLLEENGKWSAEIAGQQAQLESLNARIAEAEEQLSMDRSREEGQSLESQLMRLQSQLKEVQEEARSARADPAELRDKLFRKTKEDNERLVRLQQVHREVLEDSEAKRKAVADLDMDLDERRDESGESQKVEKLYQRDAEMSEFIDSFPKQKEAALEEKRRLQHTIVALLEHISNELERQNNLPSADQVKGLEEDTAAKETELEHAQNTQQHLQTELMKRQQELDKIATLDQKISMELKTLADRMEVMKTEMVTYANIDELKATHERIMAMLEQKRVVYMRRFDMVRLQVNALSGRYERLKGQVANNETAKALDSHEQKIRHYEQSIFTMREYIDTKGRETEYESIRDDCNKMVEEVNATTIKAQASMGPSIAASTAAPY